MNKYLQTAAAAVLVSAALTACGKSDDRLPVKDTTPDSSSPIQTATTEQPLANNVTSSDVTVIERAPKPSSDTDTDSAVESDTEYSDEEKTSPETMALGGLTLSAEEIQFNENVVLKDADKTDAALSGDTLYLLDGRSLRRFSFGSKLEEGDPIPLAGSYTRIDNDPYGRIFLSRDRFDCAVLDETGELRTIDIAGKLSMSKVMEYGLCTNGGAVTDYADSESGSWTTVSEENEFPEDVTAVEFVGNHLLFASESDSPSISVCDYEAKVLAKTSGGAISKITAMTEGGGVIAASSCGDLCLWDETGDLIGRLGSDDTAALLGTDSPVVIKRLFTDDSGSLLACCTDNNANARMFRISMA